MMEREWNMENKLKRLFDYQKFAGNNELDSVIKSVNEATIELSDDALNMVSAAGTGFRSLEMKDSGELPPSLAVGKIGKIR